MPLSPQTLRRLFAAGAVLAVLVAAGFYLQGILRGRHAIKLTPRNIPANIARSGKGFTYSQSQGGKTLFTIHAANFQQFKDAGRAEGGKAVLHDVNITVYGQKDNRSDRIYGSEFVYDPDTGDVSANGEVHIDLEADPNVNPSSNQENDEPNLIHVKTSGLTFNRKTGIALTRERIEFRMPRASGTAVGATYDSHASELKLTSAVRIVTTEKQKATITGQSAAITKEPRQIVLRGAKVEQPERTISADVVTILLHDDSTVAKVVGSGNLHAVQPGPKGFEITSEHGELQLAENNQPRSATLWDGVEFATRGGQTPSQGRAGKVLLTFTSRGDVSNVRAEDSVDVTQGPGGKSEELIAAAVDLKIRDGKTLETAVTSNGPAQIIANQGAVKNTITAGVFEAKFDGQNKLKSVTGTPNAKIVSATSGQPDRVASGKQLVASFNSKGEISAAEFAGDFHYEEGQRTATADRARYNVADESYVLSGSPRVVDSGATLVADTIQMNRKSGDASGQGNVKTTYNDLKAQPNGAMLSSAEPIHVTGATVVANRSSGSARYTAARLWQGANIIEAPSLTFDKNRRSLAAQSSPNGRVTCVFVQNDKNGKITPVNVTADKLSYVDSERKAVFSGHVQVRSEDVIMMANSVQILLLARGGESVNQSGNQLDRIVAQGDIHIEQAGRKAQGNQVVYTAAEQKFVLTGTPGHRPSIFDAEHGQITGDSLTFYTQGDRVLVGSGETPTPHTNQESRRE